MFKRTQTFFAKPTFTNRYAATLDMGLFNPQYRPKLVEPNQDVVQQTIKNKLAYPEKYELKRVDFPRKIIAELKEELMSSNAPTY